MNLVKSSAQEIGKLTNIEGLLEKAMLRPVKRTPYTANISRECPMAIMFLIDQSGSMSNGVNMKGENMTMAQAVARIVNLLISDIESRCNKGGEFRDYFHLCMIGYGGVSNNESNLLWQGTLNGREWVGIAELREAYLRKERVEEERTVRGKVQKVQKEVKYWIEPKAAFGTPMEPAFTQCEQLLKKWIAAHSEKDCFPPVVFNITDGSPTNTNDERMMEAAKRIKNLYTSDGNVLLFNIHISSKSTDSVIFPVSMQELPDCHESKLLFDMSSEMPKPMLSSVAEEREDEDVMGSYVAMGFNANMSSLVKILNVGTQATKSI